MQKKLKRMLASMLAVVMVLCAVPVSGDVFTAEAVGIPSDAVEFNGHYYKAYDDGIAWTEAKERCENMGGYLATISSVEEQNFVHGILKTKNAYWIGAHRDANGWAWVDGSDFSYTNWGSGEPNNQASVESYAEMIRIKYKHFRAGKWNDLEDYPLPGRNEEFYRAHNLGFVCEWEDTAYTFIGTLDSYLLSVILDDGKSWVSQMTINGNTFDVYGDFLNDDDVKTYVGQKVLIKLNQGKVVSFKPVSEIETDVSCNVSSPNEIYYKNISYSESEVPLNISIYNNLINETYEGQQALKNLKEYDITANSVVLETSDKDIINFDGKDKVEIPLNQSISAGDNYLAFSSANINRFHLISSKKAYETVDLKCTFNGTKNGSDFTKTSTTTIKIENKNYKDPTNKDNEGTVSSKEAAEKLNNIGNAVSLNNSYLSDIFTQEQLDALENLIMCEIAMATISKEKLKEADLSTKVIDKVFSINSNLLGLNSGSFYITVAVKTEKYGTLEVKFRCNYNQYLLNGNGFGYTGSVNYEIIKGKVPDTIPSSGLAGMIAEADVSAFCKGAQDIAMSELKSAYNLAWGNDANKAADIIFGKSVNKVLSYTKYKSVSGLTWAMMITPAKQVKIKCPVDVYVYNSDNELVACVENNQVVLTDENAQISVNGDEKEVLLFDDSYRIEYKATASGEMNISVSEYGTSDTKLRTTEIENIPLSVGKTFTQNIDTKLLEDSDYSLTDSDSTVYAPTADETVFHTHVSDGEWYDGDPATCTMDGYKYSLCTVCGDWFLEFTDSATGHTEVTDSAVVPTCTETGLTEGSHCSVCGDVLVAQKTILAVGHQYVAVATNPTCLKEGCMTQTCSICGDTYTEVLPATGHTDENADGKCDTCGETLDAVKNCTHLCHKTGFLGFIWKILNFFNKLFKINPVCSCGVRHY